MAIFTLEITTDGLINRPIMRLDEGRTATTDDPIPIMLHN